MTEALVEHEPVIRPAVVRRALPGALEVMERTTDDGRSAVCVFWGAEHGRRDMYAAGLLPEDGWQAAEVNVRSFEEALVGMCELRGEELLVYVEPAPGQPYLKGLFEIPAFMEFLEYAMRLDEASSREAE